MSKTSLYKTLISKDVNNAKTPQMWGFLVGGIGLEPTTFAMSTQRSNQLS